MAMAVPLAGNVLFALSIDRALRLFALPAALRRMNAWAGVLRILVGLAIPFA